jgi:TolA-binding protein
MKNEIFTTKDPTKQGPSPARRFVIPASFALALLAHGALAEEPALLASARRALAESAPQIAIQKLRTYLGERTLTAADRQATLLLLAEAQLADARFDDALATVEPLAAAGDPAARALKASALAAAGRWLEALALFHDCASAPNAPLTVRLGEAESFQALGRTPEAVEVLEKVVREAPSNVTVRLRLAGLYIELQKLKRAHALLDLIHPVAAPDIKWKRYVEARLQLAEGHAAPALTIFEELIQDQRDISEGLLAAITIGAGEARIVVRGYDAADKPLETFIWRHPESPWLELVFRRLDQIYAQQENPGESELQKWAAKQPPRCAALARFYVARMQMRAKKADKAAWSLNVFVENYPAHPLLTFAHLMQADLLLEKRDVEGAVRALDAAERAVRTNAQRAEIELRRGLVLFQQRQFLLAANEFQRAATHSPKLHDNATFDAALAALEQENYDRFLTEYRTLTESSPDSPLRADLILEEGFSQAAHGDARAEETLQLFLHHFPLSTRQDEARLALAELAYAGDDATAAANYLRVANESADPATAEHTDYLAIFLAEKETPPAPEKVVQLANEFIRKRPTSPLLAEVRMKLGQVYFQRGDFAGAETQFTTLAREAPASAYAETALFLAGQSAMQSINAGAVDRALDLFREVVKRDGELKLYARQQQAIVQGRLGKETDAIDLYDAILAAQPPAEPELRYAALAGKGESLRELGRKDRGRLTAALAVFAQLATQPGVPPAWRNQALYKKSNVLALLDRQPEALTALYDVLDQGRTAPREYFWYYKAGFDLATAFEQQSNWKSAIGIYEKMAALEGPRAADATAMAKDLRLKHFIWE